MTKQHAYDDKKIEEEKKIRTESVGETELFELSN